MAFPHVEGRMNKLVNQCLLTNCNYRPRWALASPRIDCHSCQSPSSHFHLPLRSSSMSSSHLSFSLILVISSSWSIFFGSLSSGILFKAQPSFLDGGHYIGLAKDLFELAVYTDPPTSLLFYRAKDISEYLPIPNLQWHLTLLGPHPAVAYSTDMTRDPRYLNLLQGLKLCLPMCTSLHVWVFAAIIYSTLFLFIPWWLVFSGYILSLPDFRAQCDSGHYFQHKSTYRLGPNSNLFWRYCSSNSNYFLPRKEYYVISKTGHTNK